MSKKTFSNVEQYMTRHDFLEADKVKAYCPYCGQRLMLCSMCDGPCDYYYGTDSCKYNKQEAQGN